MSESSNNKSHAKKLKVNFWSWTPLKQIAELVQCPAGRRESRARLNPEGVLCWGFWEIMNNKQNRRETVALTASKVYHHLHTEWKYVHFHGKCMFEQQSEEQSGAKTT